MPFTFQVAIFTSGAYRLYRVDGNRFQQHAYCRAFAEALEHTNETCIRRRMAQQPDYAVEEVTVDLVRLRIAFVNVYVVGRRAAAAPTRQNVPSWTLIDAGLPMGAARILALAADRFGVDSPPSAIVLTHGHFDHVGALEALLAVWDVPVYAHMAELPFLTGQADYPPPDATVGGGLPARLSPLVPERGIDLGERVRSLPANGQVPSMSDWRWVHTPGHAPGHVALFRERDRVLLAGDAMCTTRQETAYAMAPQHHRLSGPPAYFTIDWDKAGRSAAAIASLKPLLLAAGHGEPMRGPALSDDLVALARDFDRRARPSHGRYVTHPAMGEDDGAAAPRPRLRSGRVRWGTLSGVAAAGFAGTWLYRRFGKRSET
jgi:glyoxylase-like metal-dependent hydrolase (beta-lactamase superfamily II)